MASSTLEQCRDIKAAKLAYNKKDAFASAAAHSPKPDIEMANRGSSPEEHQKAGEYVKSVVLGGLDGIVTTFAVVSGARGGGLGLDVILVLGFSSILADALSMGIGDGLSRKAEEEYALAERDRENWEMEHYPEGEIQEMIQIFTQKGMTSEDAEVVMRKYGEYPDLFVDFMMHFELDLQVPTGGYYGWVKNGFVTFCSFLFFGVFPLLAYVVLYKTTISEEGLFTISCIVSAVMFFLLGAFKTKFSNKRWYLGGLEIFFMGSGTAAVSYGVGYLVEGILSR